MKWEEEWVEAFTLAFVTLGALVSILIKSDLFTFISIFLAGFLAARSYYIRRFKEPILPFLLIIVGFLTGYVVASFWSSRITILLIFGLGFGVSYYLHMKKILVIFKSRNFVK